MLDQFQERLNAGVAYDPNRRPEAVQSLESWSGASDELNYAPTRHVKGALRACAGIRRLWVSAADEALIDEAAEVRGLEVLFVERPTAVSFASLGKSPSLRALGIFNTQEVLTLESLATLTRLRTLSLRNLSRVHDLSPLGSLPDLEALAIDGPVERNWKVDSLAPLGSLVKLQSLFIASLLVSDGLLTPLSICGHYGFCSAPGASRRSNFAGSCRLFPGWSVPGSSRSGSRDHSKHSTPRDRPREAIALIEDDLRELER